MEEEGKKKRVSEPRERKEKKGAVAAASRSLERNTDEFRAPRC